MAVWLSLAPMCRYPAKTLPAPDAEAPPWLWLCHLPKERIGCHLGMWGGFIVMFTSGGHLYQLRCALCCGGGVPIPGHAILIFACLANAEAHPRHKAVMCQPCCCIDVWIMRVGIWSCLSFVLECRTTRGSSSYSHDQLRGYGRRSVLPFGITDFEP